MWPPNSHGSARCDVTTSKRSTTEGAAGPARRRDVTAFVTLFIVCVFAIPQNYVLKQAFGGLGAPAIFVAWGALAWWFFATVYPSSGLNRGLQPIRLAIFAFLASLLLSFGFANLGGFPSEQA